MTRYEPVPKDADVLAAAELTVYALFRSRVRSSGASVALVCGDRRVTYTELEDRVARTAAVLMRAGIQRGDRIALLSENRAEYLELVLAAAMTGCIVACLSWRMTVPELRHCVTLVRPKLLLVSARYADKPREIGAEVPVVVIDDELAALVQASERLAHPAADLDPEDGLIIIYTSGTTGLPKGALISHRAEIARMIAHRLDLNVTREDGFVAWSPLFHSACIDPSLGMLMSGAPVIIIDGFIPERIVDALGEYRIGWMILMPGTIEPVLELLRKRKVRPKGVRVVGAMADLVPPALIAQISDAVGAPFLNSFGATETGLPPASGSILEVGKVPTSLSKQQSSLCELMIVDANGNKVLSGAVGEAVVRGPTLFSGYWDASDATTESFRGGWFHMGDLFRRNSDGSLDFVDRAKYLIKSGGENIYPAEIERVLLADPRVADAAVIRRKDDLWGEVPVAIVAAIDPNLTVADIDAICDRGLPRFKRPKAVHFVTLEELPRNSTGKIERQLLEIRFSAVT